MALRLEVISGQRQQLGSRASIVLGVAGGSIGRALDNDWALPDVQRYLSGHHARIHFRQGGYFLEDTSSNGVYVNESTTPQAQHGLYQLRAGDVLRMGEYRVLVHFDEDEPFQATPGPHTMSQLTVENVVPLRAAGGQTDLGASLNIEALIPDQTGPAAKLGAAAAMRTGATSARQSTGERLTRLRAAARARLEGNAAPLAHIHSGMQAFCHGAGLDPTTVPMESDAQSLHLAGRLLREALIGLKEILRAQQEFRDRNGIESEPPEGTSPLDRGSDEYLLELICGHERRQLDAVMQLRDQFSDAAGHAAAIDPALRSALGQFMSHLAPARVETGAGGTDAAANWVRYKEIFGNLLASTGEQMPHLFLEALAQAYLAARKGRS